MPETKTAEGAAILIWVLSSGLGLAVATCLFFVRRWFSETNETGKKLVDKFEGQDDRLSAVTDKMGEHAQRISSELIKFRADAVEFQQKVGLSIQELKTYSMNSQSKVNEELVSLDKHTNRIELIMDRTLEKATELDKGIDRNSTQVKELLTHVENHSKILRTFAEIVKTQKIKLGVTENDYTTLKKEVGNLTWLIAKKKPEDPK